MGSVALLQSLKEGILGQASVKTIYGEPVSAHGKTIVPVAKIMYMATARGRVRAAWAIRALAVKAAGVAAACELFPWELSRLASSRRGLFRAAIAEN
jgi:uncharacterized spore protein YtfJ